MKAARLQNHGCFLKITLFLHLHVLVPSILDKHAGSLPPRDTTLKPRRLRIGRCFSAPAQALSRPCSSPGVLFLQRANTKASIAALSSTFLPFPPPSPVSFAFIVPSSGGLTEDLVSEGGISSVLR